MKSVLFGSLSILILIPVINSIEVDVKIGDKLEICCKLKPDSEKDGLTLSVGNTRLKMLIGNSLIVQDIEKFTKDNPGFDVIRNNETLCLVKSQTIQKDDNAMIQCSVVKSGFGATLTEESYTLRVFEKLEFVTKLDKMLKVISGASINTACTAIGSPDLQVIWRTETTGKLSSGSSTAVLQLDNVTVAMNGKNYICEASTSIPKTAEGTISQTITLDVQYKPEIDIKTLIVHTDIGTEETFQINVKGNPQPKIQCSLLNVPVNRIIAISSTSPYDYNYDVKIDKITEKEIGKYQCTATNDVGSVTKEVTLSVNPENLQVTSPNETSSSNCYILSWKMNSKSPIVNFTITTDVVNEMNSTSTVTIQNSDFSSILKSTGNKDNNWEQIFSYSFQNLTSERSYVISLQTCNRHKCVMLKNIVHFKTLKSSGENKCDPNKFSTVEKTGDPSKTSWNLKPILLFVITQSTTMLFITLVLQQI